MKQIIFISNLIFIIMILWGCEDVVHHPYGDDDIPPGQVIVGEIVSKHGGAEVNFTAPSDADVMYVQAVYTDDRGIQREVKVSATIGMLLIEGFGKVGDYNVNLYAVDRNENKSEAVSTAISVLEAPVDLVFPTLLAEVDYGGIKVSYENDLNAEVSINVLVNDSSRNEMVFRESFFTSQSNGSYSFRGYESKKTKFGLYVEDKWGNVSDTLITEVWPIPDEYLDKSKFAVYNFPGDKSFNEWGFYATMMWNDVWNSTWDIGASAEAELPHHLTIDLGVNAKLSRFKLYQRTQLGTTFSDGNPKVFNVYGLKDLNSLPQYDPENPNAGWTLLKECVSIKPSGSPEGVNTEEDLQIATKGEDFEFDLENSEEIRYVRFEFLETWGGIRYVVVGELSFWGEILDSE